MKRPGGITILAVLAILSGVLGLMWACIALGFGSFANAFIAPVGSFFGGSGQIGRNAMYSGLGTLLGAAFWIAAGVGALYLKSWAWIVGVVAAGISSLSAILGLFTNGLGWICLTLPSLVLPIGILVYLLMPGVRKAFGQA